MAKEVILREADFKRKVPDYLIVGAMAFPKNPFGVLGEKVDMLPFDVVAADANSKLIIKHTYHLEEFPLVYREKNLSAAGAIAPIVFKVMRAMVDQNPKETSVEGQQNVSHDVGDERPTSELSSPQSTIPFSEADLDDVQHPHNDALMIELEIKNQSVKRILVDQGSSYEIMYLNLFNRLNMKMEELEPINEPMYSFNEEPVQPIGSVTLPIIAGSVIVQTKFLVVDVPSSPFDAIMGIPWLHEMKAVASSYYQKLKFPNKMGGIEVIKGNQAISRECYKSFFSAAVMRSLGSFSQPLISFSVADLKEVEVPHKDALLITLEVAGKSVERLFVDPGSSFDVMYLNFFETLDPEVQKLLKTTNLVGSGFDDQETEVKGMVTLPIRAGSVIVKTDFLVVNKYSECNALLGIPWLHKMRAVPSSYHQKLKFPTETGGIEVIEGNQEVSRACNKPKAKAEKKIVPASGIADDGCMGLSSRYMSVLDFDKFVDEEENVGGGDSSSAAAVEEVGASSELLKGKSLLALDDDDA